jgi:hypothetical protein
LASTKIQVLQLSWRIQVVAEPDIARQGCDGYIPDDFAAATALKRSSVDGPAAVGHQLGTELLPAYVPGKKDAAGAAQRTSVTER